MKSSVLTLSNCFFLLILMTSSSIVFYSCQKETIKITPVEAEKILKGTWKVESAYYKFGYNYTLATNNTYEIVYGYSGRSYKYKKVGSCCGPYNNLRIYKTGAFPLYFTFDQHKLSIDTAYFDYSRVLNVPYSVVVKNEYNTEKLVLKLEGSGTMLEEILPFTYQESFVNNYDIEIIDNKNIKLNYYNIDLSDETIRTTKCNIVLSKSR